MMFASAAQVVVSLVILTTSSSAIALNATRQHRPVRTAAARDARRHLRCGDLLSFQVLLDRQGVSPGVIDGNGGDNMKRALAALQERRGLPATGQPDCATWRALGGETSDSTVTTYTVTSEDVKGPFEPQIPRELVAQAKLPTLAYRSALEKLAERFHTSPALLQQLNRGTPIAAGRRLRVPAVSPFDPTARPAFDRMADDVTLLVSREESTVRATHADGSLMFFAPATIGSDHDPLPTGDWKVTGIDWHPAFHYNPDLFWDAKATDTKATIKPGPNNPVGVVWISLNLEHYGLHGTPEPSQIGHTESHGCVRLTNWDAARVASLVKPGTPVLFR